MSCKRSTALVLSVLILCLAGLPLFAQTVTGTLSGRVVDSTGAVIPGAKLQIKGEQTGLVRDTVSNDEGYYVFTFVPLGTYEVTASSASFRTVQKKGVGVSLNQTTNSDFRLEPATAAEVITVTGEAPLIETAGGEVKGTLDTKLIEDRPLSGRNFLALTNTIAGYQTNLVSGQNNPTASSGSSVNFNGTGTRGASFQIDGVNNDDSSENQNRQGVNISTIQQMQVLTNNYSSEFGRSYGSVVLVQTKQGTNKIHGDAFWFHTNSITSTRGYYDPATITVAPNRRHDFGGTLGGPIIKNKLFFFGSFEDVRNGGSTSYRRDIMLPSDKVIIEDGTNPVPLTAADRAWIQSIFDRFPNVLPNEPTRNPRSYFTRVKYHYPTEDYTGRIDWNISTRNTLAARYQYSHQNYATDEIIRGEQTNQNNRQQNLGITLAHIFSNTQTGEFRAGVGRRETRVDLKDGNDTPVLRFTNNGLPNSTSTIMGNAGSFPIHRFQTDWQLVYNHYWQVAPKLTLRFGTDVRPSQLNDLASSDTRGTRYVSDNNLTYKTSPPYHDAYWYFQRGMWGDQGSYVRSYGASELANSLNEYNFYAQSDIRITPSFTLNLGIRDEFVPATSERNNKINYGYGDTNSVAPRIGFAFSPQTSNAFISRFTGGPGRMSVRGGFGIFAGRLFQSYFSQQGASIRYSPPNGASPSFDIKLPQYAHFADPTGGYVFTPGTWPSTRVGITEVDPNLKLPYAEQWNLSVSRELPSQMGLTLAYVGNRGIGLPYYNMTNRALFPFTAPSADQFLPGDANVNFAGITFDCVDMSLTASNAYKDASGNYAPRPGTTHQCISPSMLYTNARRPDPRFGGNFFIRNGSWSYYNALQVTLNKRTTRGLAFQAAYTFGKALDTGSETTYTGIDTNIPLTNDARSMKGLSLFDSTHRFAITYSYELPFFKNERVAMLDDRSSVLSAIVGKILGGWQVSGATTANTGTPFTVLAGIDVNADGVGADRPDILDTSYLGKTIGDGHYVPGTTSRTVSQNEMPVSAFSAVFKPGLDNIGTLGRNTFRADGVLNFDAALAKNFRIVEGQKLMFRWELYNAMNHVQFAIPGRTVTSPASFMRITGQQNAPRSMQFALRYMF